MIVGRVDNEHVNVNTNVKQLNPMISSALLLPVMAIKHGIKMTVPFEPPTEITISHAFENYSQFILRGPADMKLGIRLDWETNTEYSIPEPGEEIYLKLDGLMSVLTYHKFKNSPINIQPFVIAYSEAEHAEIEKWLHSVNIQEKVPVIIIEYEDHKVKNMFKFENWIAVTIASLKSSTIWLPVPHPEINDYLPDRTLKMFDEGAQWLTRMAGRTVKIESPHHSSKTRTQLVAEALNEKGITEKFIHRAIRCKCGACIECFMNYVMLKNLKLSPKEVLENNWSSEFKGRMRKLIELNKLNIDLVADIQASIK